MDSVYRVCRTIKKAYAEEGVSSPTATKGRSKLAAALSKVDPAKGKEAVELVWRTAYYEPITRLRRSSSLNPRYLELTASMFSGELQCILLECPNLAQYINVFLGDIHRYMLASSSETARAKCQPQMYYERAVHSDPNWGKPLNQLGLLAQPLHDLRLFLQALVADKPFDSALDNILNALTKQDYSDSGGLVNEVIGIVKATMVQYSRFDLSERCGAWLSELRSAEELQSSEALLLLNVLSLVAKYVHVTRTSEEGTRILIQTLCDSWTFLVGKVHSVDPKDEDDELMMRRRRLRRRAGSESSEESADLDESGEVQEAREQKQETDESPEAIFSLSCVAGCAETVFAVTSITHDIVTQGNSIPGALSQSIDSLLDALCEKCNMMVDVLDSEDVDVEGVAVQWMIRGPPDARNRPQALRAAVHWVFTCAESARCPLAFAGYFKVMRSAAKAKDLGRKLAKLRKEMGGTEDTRWIPVYVVFDEDALGSRPQKVRSLLRGEKLTAVVPSAVLHHLDKNKSKGGHFRTALRLILLGQQMGHIRVEEGDVEQCAKKLCPSDQSTSTSSTSTTSGTLVAVLTTDTQKYEGLKEFGGALAVHHIDSFCDRWNKEVSWRSL